MGKKYSKQAWVSREGPEGDCVVENDTVNVALNLTEEPKERTSCTADFTYKGYPVNVLQDVPSASEKDFRKEYSYFDYPIEVVELPDEPDGKKYDVYFEHEGQVEASTQTMQPVMAQSECGQSLKSSASDRQEWSYTLYDFEGQGHVTREDLKNLVKSIYDVLGKSMTKPKGSKKGPVKKLSVRLSVSKERSRDEADTTRQGCLVSGRRMHMDVRKTKARRCLSAEREGSMIVNPPSTDCLSQSRLQRSLVDSSRDENYGRHYRRATTCKRCRLKQSNEKNLPKIDFRKMLPVNPADAKGLYQYPKRKQTGPGESTPPTPCSTNMTHVKESINLGCDMNENGGNEATDEHHRHKHKVHHRHRGCQAEVCEGSCGSRRSPQYLDLATDHLTYPYHTLSQSFAVTDASSRLQRHHRHSEHRDCNQSSATDNDKNQDGQPPIIHRHEHHHHHSHHHYHHYVG
ncbi:protein naked cuticle homolog 2-like isoform X2 [Montipora capricornis]|uniref:protein naked cuticle homolog 2-like isoform X2 n=1 Tax=Montipora capricornis TaxID=246305 RepID=UPI0035F16FBE